MDIGLIDALSLHEQMILGCVVAWMAMCLLMTIVTHLHKFMEALKDVIKRAVQFLTAAFATALFLFLVMFYIKCEYLLYYRDINWAACHVFSILITVVVAMFVGVCRVQSCINSEKEEEEKAEAKEALTKLKEVVNKL